MLSNFIESIFIIHKFSVFMNYILSVSQLRVFHKKLDICRFFSVAESSAELLHLIK